MTPPVRLIAAGMAAVTFVASQSGAATPPAARVVPIGLGNEALIIPAGSPVRFEKLGKNYLARFSGRFVLTGEYSYGCDYDCEEPNRIFNLTFAPDRALMSRLPHFRVRTGDYRIYINGADPFIKAVVPAAKRAALRRGKLLEVTGRASIVVDRLTVGIECDAPSYGVRFVAIAAAPPPQSLQVAGDAGC